MDRQIGLVDPSELGAVGVQMDEPLPAARRLQLLGCVGAD